MPVLLEYLRHGNTLTATNTLTLISLLSLFWYLMQFALNALVYGRCSSVSEVCLASLLLLLDMPLCSRILLLNMWMRVLSSNCLFRICRLTCEYSCSCCARQHLILNIVMKQMWALIGLHCACKHSNCSTKNQNPKLSATLLCVRYMGSLFW